MTSKKETEAAGVPGEVTAPALTFSKAQFLKSKSFTGLQKDVIRTLLDGNKTYTRDQVRSILEEFNRKEVN